MRDMANTSLSSDRSKPGRLRTALRLRPIIQLAFLLFWAAPLGWFSAQLGRWGRSIPACVFHCSYAGGGYCPAASFTCPIGVMAQIVALGQVPLLSIGVIVLVGALVGSLVCGWACPFGFIQDLLAKIPVPKLHPPAWTSAGRYVVLGTLVLALPYMAGLAGKPYDQQELTICRWCPAGATEAGIPRTIQGAIEGRPDYMVSPKKAVIIVVFLLGSVFIHRPWCRMLCPLGGLLSLFNRFSVFHLRFKKAACTSCNTCRSRCDMDVHVDKHLNSSRCVRCLECTTCGAIEPAIFGPDGGDSKALETGDRK
jgi:ferredoxin-type protein NapH